MTQRTDAQRRLLPKSYVLYKLPAKLANGLQAAQLLQHLSVTAEVPCVVLDAAQTQQLTQPAAAQIIQMLSEHQHLIKLVVLNATDPVATHLELCADARGFKKLYLA